MRILSWNVNGITACIERGDFAQLEKLYPLDVICLQETHAKVHYHILEQYHHYWFPAERNNYSGTMVLTRVVPRNVLYGFGIPALDNEGRVLTVDLGDIYVVNTYVPNSTSRFDRQEYRRNWDRVYAAFLQHLAEEKPVIACGDFNATMSERDIFAGNSRMEEEQKGYISDERSGLHRLVEAGFCDAYRHFYPRTSDQSTWTWWSNRLYKRSEDKGWRLDYFFVDKRIADRMVEVSHHREIQGSDHCPILLDARFETPSYTRSLQKQGTYCDWQATDTRKTSQRWTNRVTHFKQYEKELSDIQAEITAYETIHQRDKVMELQQKVLDNMHFKCLAVEKVARSGAPCGVDNIKWLSNADKLLAVEELDWRTYRASPQRLIEIRSKSTGKTRYSGILTYKDKAMAILCGYAFKPVAEACADRGSYAFRPGRSRQDAIVAVENLFSGKNAPEYYVYIDIKSFYATIQHRWLLSHVPIKKEVLSEMLNAGLLFSGELFPSYGSGISEGSPLSPAIANFTLDGLQRAVYMGLHGSVRDIDYPDGALVRYADDVLVAIRSPEEAAVVLSTVQTFLEPRGLIMSDEKTKTGCIRDGITIIGFEVRKGDYSLTVRPAPAAVDRFKCSLHDYILSFRHSQRDLIEGVNKSLSGWAGQYKFCDAYESFREIDSAVQESLLEAAIRHHPKMQKAKLLNHYWYTDTSGVSWYSLECDRSVRIIHLRDAIFFAPNRSRTDINPFFQADYFTEKRREEEMQHITARYRPVWEATKGKCLYCGRPILPSQDKVLVTVDPARAPSLKNSAYAHAVCTKSDFQFLQILEDVEGLTDYDVEDLLSRISSDGLIINADRINEKWKYFPLYEYFNRTNKHSLVLTFGEIEDIIGSKLPAAVVSHASAWQRVLTPHTRRFSDAWGLNGYTAKKVYLRERKVSFEADHPDYEHVEIPESISVGRVPQAAKYEIEHFLDAIIKKYNLTNPPLLPGKPATVAENSAFLE